MTDVDPQPERRQRLRRSERPAIGAVVRYGPLTVVSALLVTVIVLLATAPDRGTVATDRGGGPSTVRVGGASDGPGADVRLPPGVESFPRALAAGRAKDIDWGDRCDTDTGKVKLPLWPQQDCFAPFSGDNGGSTDTGVSADTIKVVVYLSQEDDPVLKFIYSQIGNNDTPDDIFDTYVGFAEIFNRYDETYGRKVELVRYDATGTISDPTAATADAEAIARDIAPFFVIGGPNLTNAFADTLARNGIGCIACTPAQPAAWYAERAPYVWDVQRNADQALQTAAEYIGKRLVGRPAAFAGDPALQDDTRVFGYVHVVSSDSSQELEDRFTGILRDDYGMEFATIQTYGLPTELAASGKDIVTRMKEAGVTTVVFSGDPLAPQTLTRIATEQNWFPEWVVGPSVLVDTAVFARTYDQRQWAHAFGPSGLFARVEPGVAGPGYLYRWYFGTEAPASGTVPLLAGSLQVLFGAIQGMGPNVTHELFQQVLFGAPITPSTPITAQISFGDHGFFPDLDFSALDDATEIWWDPEAPGPDELGNTSSGLWRYVDGGKRWLPGEWPGEQPSVFRSDGAVTVYDAAPAGTKLPDYEPLR